MANSASPDGEYERMKRFMAIFATAAMGIASDSEVHPSRVLEAMEAKSPANAKKGVRMAVNDMVEQCEGRSPDYVARLDAHLAANDAMTLSEARNLFSKSLRAVLKRVRIRTETEYYLVRNAVESAAPDAASTMWALLADFETRAASGNA
ncbi:MAG: hypothetical protein ABIS51_06140 [Sphingomonas sp.]